MKDQYRELRRLFADLEPGCEVAPLVPPISMDECLLWEKALLLARSTGCVVVKRSYAETGQEALLRLLEDCTIKGMVN